MDIYFLIIGAKNRGTNVVITIILWITTHTQKTMGGNLCAWNEVYYGIEKETS
jgi:hypothetical protein